MDNELTKHAMGDKIKWICTLLAFILVGVLLAGLICGWFVKKENTPSGTVQTEQLGGMLLPEEMQGNGVKLKSSRIALADYATYGISEQAESAQTVTAVIIPSDATNREVDFSVEWTNPSSVWAERTVTDYVSVNQTTDGALTATVTCLKAFPTQISIKVTSRENAEITASLPVDYVKKNLVAGFQKYYEGHGYESSTGFSFGDTVDYRLSTNFNDLGTITPEIALTNFKVGFSEDELQIHELTSCYKGEYSLSTNSLKGFNYENLFNCSTAEFVEKMSSSKHTMTPHCMYMKCNYTLTYNGTNFGSGEVRQTFGASASNLKVSVNGVGFEDDNGLIF